MRAYYKYFFIPLVFYILFSSIAFTQELSLEFIDLKKYIISANSLSLDNENNYYILDSDNNKVVKFSTDGKLLKEIGGWGWGNLNFDKPVSIDASSGLNVYVSDYYNNRVLRFNKQLEYISSLSSKDKEDELFSFGFPTVIAVDRFSNLFLYDGENNRILKFDKDGKYDRTFGGIESVTPKIIRPRKMEINSENNVFILEERNLFIFDNWGSFLRIVKLDSLDNIKTFCTDGNNIFLINSDGSLFTLDFYGRILDSYNLSLKFDQLNIHDIRDIRTDQNYFYILTKESIVALPRRSFK
jgi:DNA-binding beta-propeller fold protein YncE